MRGQLLCRHGIQRGGNILQRLLPAQACVLEIAALLELRTGLRPPRVVAFDVPSAEADLRLFGDAQAWTGQTLQIDIVFHLEAHEVPFELMIKVKPECLPAVKQTLAKRI